MRLAPRAGCVGESEDAALDIATFQRLMNRSVTPSVVQIVA